MKLNWIYRCIIYFFISMILGPYYDGWSSTAKYLISEGVFSKSCKDINEPPKLYYLKPLCDDQAYNVGTLLSFYRISEFLSSIFIGIFMDNVGPKITVLLSIILRILSWILIPLFTNNMSIVILSCILCGITSNGIAFPVFTIAQYSKKYYNACMIVISVSLSFGTFYTFILNWIKYGLSDYSPIKIIIIKLALTHVPLILLSSFVFPNVLERDVKMNLPEEISSKIDQDLTPEIDRKSSLEEKKWDLKEFISILSRVDILVLSISAMVNVISLTFAQESFPIEYGNDKVALMINEILIPLSFIFSICSVFLLNKFGSVPIIVVLNFVGSLIHLTMLFRGTALSVFTSLLMSLGYSLFMSQYYIYLDKQVPLTYQGSIKGFLVTSIGFVLFINIGLNHLSKTYDFAREIHLIIMVIRMIVSVPLVRFLKHKQGRSKSLEIIV